MNIRAKIINFESFSTSLRSILREFLELQETQKLAKQYISKSDMPEQQKQELLDTLTAADPTKNKKYVGWMAKIYLNEKPKPDLNDLRNKVEEFDTLSRNKRTKTTDIYQFKSFEDLKNEVEEINQSGEATSVKDLEKDYEVVVDTDDMYIAVPHTHEASRKLGLSKFAFRDCEGGKDSAWCTTYKAPDHFNDYYYKKNVTLYYIRVKSEGIIEKLRKAFPEKWKEFQVVALAVLKKNKIDGYDGLDKQMSEEQIKKYMAILGLTK